MVLGHYKLVLLGTWWYRVTIGLLCLLNKVEIWSGVTYASHTYLTHRPQDLELVSWSKVKNISWVTQYAASSLMHSVFGSIQDWSKKTNQISINC